MQLVKSDAQRPKFEELGLRGAQLQRLCGNTFREKHFCVIFVVPRFGTRSQLPEARASNEAIIPEKERADSPGCGQGHFSLAKAKTIVIVLCCRCQR